MFRKRDIVENEQPDQTKTLMALLTSGTLGSAGGTIRLRQVAPSRIRRATDQPALLTDELSGSAALQPSQSGLIDDRVAIGGIDSGGKLDV
jgi:hypothetical protein